MAKNMQTNILLGGKVLPSLNNAFAMANKKMMQANKTSSIFSKTTGVMSRAFSAASRFIGLDTLLMGAGFAYVGQKGLMLASDLVEVQNVVDVTFEKSAKIIDAWAKTASDSFGLTELQAKQYTGSMGAMLKSSGLNNDMFLMMSKNLTGLAADIASFHNLSPETAFEKIMSGMSGQVMPLRELGINMNIANLEAFALSKGIKTTWSKMNQANQTAIRYAYLIEITKDKQGDFTKNQGEFANQLRLTKNNFNRIISTLAGKFLPVANKGLIWANNFMTSLDVDKLSQSFSNFGGKVADVFTNYIKPGLDWAVTTGWPMLKDGIKTAFEKGKRFTGFIVDNWPIIESVLLGITSTMAMVYTKFFLIPKAIDFAKGAIKTFGAISKSFAAASAFLTSPFGMAVLAVGALVTAGVFLYKNWDKVKDTLISIWGSIKSVFTSGINFIIGSLNKINFTIPDWVPAFGGKTFGFNIPLLPTYASGGFSSRAAIFGEAGLEAAIPIKPGNPRSIGLLNKTAQMLGVSNSVSPIITINQTINAHGDDAKTIADTSADKITTTIEDYFHNKHRLSFGI